MAARVPQTTAVITKNNNKYGFTIVETTKSDTTEVKAKKERCEQTRKHERPYDRSEKNEKIGPNSNNSLSYEVRKVS